MRSKSTKSDPLPVVAFRGENGCLYKLHGDGCTVLRQNGKVTTVVVGWRGVRFDSNDAALTWAEMDARESKRDKAEGHPPFGLEYRFRVAVRRLSLMSGWLYSGPLSDALRVENQPRPMSGAFGRP